MYVWYMFKSNVNIRKTNWDKFEALPIPNYVIVEDLDHGVRRGQSKEQQEYHKVHEALQRQRKTVLAQFSNDSTNAVSTEIHNVTVDDLKISVCDWMNFRSRIIHTRQRMKKDCDSKEIWF